MSPRPILAIALALAVVALSARPAQADKRVVVLEIEGARTPRLRKEIVRAIRPHDAMSAQSYRNAARRLRAEKLTPNNVAEVAGYLGADGVLDGTIVAEDGGYILTIRLRSGKEGLIVKRIGIRLSEPRLPPKIEKGLRKRLVPVIDDLPPLKGGDDSGPVASGPTEGSFADEADEREAAERRETKRERRRREARERRERAKREREERRERARAEREQRRREKEEARERRRRDEEEARERRRREDEERERDRRDRRDDEEMLEDEEMFADDERFDDEEPLDDEERVAEVRDDEDPVGGDSDADVERDAEDAAAPRTPRERPLTFLAGLSVAQRTLAFTVAEGLENAPLGYDGSPVPGAFLRGALYPGAFGDGRGFVSNLGVSFLFDQVLKINSAVQNPNTDMTEIIPTKQQRWSVGLNYRMNFGDQETSPQLVLGVGYGKTKFLLDKGAVSEGLIVDVPNVAYTLVDPGARFRIGVVDNAFFYAEGRFLLVLDTGEMQTPEQYGTARVIGVDADGGLEYVIGDRYLVRAGAHLQYFGYTFQGNGTLNDRNGDGEIDVGGAADQYLGGYLLGGFTF